MRVSQTPTRIGNFRAFPASREIDSQAGSADSVILRLVGENKRVLDLGCASGQLSGALREQGCAVVGIEIHPEAAQQAAASCERVIEGDLEYLDFQRELAGDRFDVVLAADVLSQLRDPLSVLQAVRQFLSPDGYFVISIRNVAHISVRLARLTGKFPSTQSTVDETHLRFLTRELVEKLMDAADLAIGHFERIASVPMDLAQFEASDIPGSDPSVLFDHLARDPESWTSRFVIAAHPLPVGGLAFIQDRFRRVAQEAEAARMEAANLRAEAQQALEAATAARAELDRARAEIVALRADAHSARESSALLARDNAVLKEGCAILSEEGHQLSARLESLRNAHQVEGDRRASEHQREMAGLQAQAQTLLRREKDLREMLLDAHEQLLRRDDEIAVTLASALPQKPAVPPVPVVPPPPPSPLPAPSAAASVVESLRPEARPFGVNVSGNLTSEKGVGTAVRGQVRSLIAAGVPVVLNNVVDNTSVNAGGESLVFSDDNPYGVNLIHLNADALPSFAAERGDDYFKERYNIGFWAWETSAFPEHWWDRFPRLNEIWVGSNFVLDAVSRVAPIPVIKTPLSVSIPPWNPHARSLFGFGGKTCVFLFAFDYMSVVQRKNPAGLIQAFRKAFRAKDDVLLVLKSAHAEAYPEEAARLRQASAGLNVRFIDDVAQRKDVSALMDAADCYVSLHRSEGFGLTMAEAMSHGKPVIATAYSGNMEFMNSGNSYLVKYRLKEIDRPYGPYESGEWADPDLDHAADRMRYVLEHRGEAREMGRRARADVARNLPPAASGAVMRDRLIRLGELGRIVAPALETGEGAERNSSQRPYQQLVARILRIVETQTPADARVLVVSKGDDELLGFAERDGSHFPQDSEGGYAGHYPSSDDDAIQHLQALREQGGDFLVFPQTAFWWLDHYSSLRSHLESRHRRVWNDPDCVIYALGKNGHTASVPHGKPARTRKKPA